MIPPLALWSVVRLSRRCTIRLLLAGSLCACSPPSEPAPAAGSSTAIDPGHERMLAALQDVAERTADEHFFLGDRTARKVRGALANLPPSAGARTRWKLHHQAGVLELRLGNVQASIRHFSRAHELADAASLSPLWRQRTAFDLAMAYLRLGEVENCCARNTPESCILPIREGGRHRKPEGSRQAIHFFREVLESSPADRSLHLAARWLLNVAFMTVGGYPGEVPREFLVPPDSFAARRGFPRFRNVAAALGVDTVSLSGGAVVDDLDGDDYLDILVSTWDTTGQIRLLRNGRDGTFEDRTKAAGLSGIYGGLNLKQADYNNDGHLDVLVLRGAWLGAAGRHPNSLLRNNGDGTFTDVTFALGLGDVHYPTQTAAWADYDNDGDVDLYVGNEWTERLQAPCQLFRNEGGRRFVDVAAEAGVQNRRFTKGVVWGDFDGDRFPDLYVSNLNGPNRLYRNSGEGTFADVAPGLGVADPHVSFPVWFWDFDNDGTLDIYASSYAGRVSVVAAHYLGESVSEGLPCLYRGVGRGRFRNVARECGLTQPVLPMGSNFGDLNGDGYLDFYLGTGDPDFQSLMPNLMFLNRGGRQFENVTMAGGFGHLQKGHSVAFADLDNDGDLDIFEQMGGAYRGDEFADALYENPGFGHGWLTVHLVGVESNRAAIGARIRIEVREAGGSRSIYRHVTSGGSFGANPLRQTIGLGSARRIEALEVFWPRTGKTQRYTDVEVDQGVRITEGQAELERLNLTAVRFSASTPRPGESR